MLKRTLLTALLSATLIAAARAQPVSPTGQKQHKVVIQISDNDPAKWNLALNNARNIQEELGAANVDVEMVAFGPGIQMFKIDSAVNARIGEATKAGIKLLACENTLRNTKVNKDDIAPTVGYVPAGMVHLMRRQADGWAYLRP
jgi:uncharacterized protein